MLVSGDRKPFSKTLVKNTFTQWLELKNALGDRNNLAN